MRDTQPHFSSEAQETFTEGSRIYAVLPSINVGEGQEGVYDGRFREYAVVRWDTPDGHGMREAVPFASIRNLYR